MKMQLFGTKNSRFRAMNHRNRVTMVELAVWGRRSRTARKRKKKKWGQAWSRPLYIGFLSCSTRIAEKGLAPNRPVNTLAWSRRYLGENPHACTRAISVVRAELPRQLAACTQAVMALMFFSDCTQNHR